MALKSLSALAKAIDAVKKEAGDFAEHKPLLDALSGVTKHLGETEPDKSRNSDDDDYSFEAAEKRHVQRSAEIRDGGKADSESSSSGGSDA
jgi:hypothetical protein